MTASVELYLDQGTTFYMSISLTDDITNAPINVTNYTISSQMRKSYYSQNASANLVCTISDGANGAIALSLDSANTTNIKAGRYLFDVISEDQLGTVSRLIEGTITVTPSITRNV